MKKFFCFLALCFFILYYSQKPARSIIDSVYSADWKKMMPDLDSLANPTIMGVEIKNRDTVVINTKMELPTIVSPVPITPFSLNNFKEDKRWYLFGQNKLIFNQASYSNWNSGGTNNIGLNGRIFYNLSYKNQKHYFESVLKAGYGWINSKNQGSRKTDDFLNVNANYGYDLGKNYYFYTGLQFLSQFSPGYNYTATPSPTFEDRISRFMSPGYFNLGVGISYNPSENLQIIFRPVNGKFTFVQDPVLQKKGKYGLEKDGQSFIAEVGAMLDFIYRLRIAKNVQFDHQLSLFSNYLSHSERVDFAYSGALHLRFSKLINTAVTIDLMYDHDQVQKLQLKQGLGIEITHDFGNRRKEQNSSKKTFKPFVTK